MEIAKEYDLYTLKDIPDDQNQVVEKEILGNIENLAEPPLKQMISGAIRNLSPEDKLSWAIFLNSFRFRHPTGVKELEDAVAKRVDEAFRDNQEELDQLRNGNAPLSWQKLFNSYRPGYLPNLHLGLMVELIASGPLVQQLLDLHWSLHNLDSAELDLVLGDRPFVTVAPTDFLPGFSFLPIAKRRLFIVCDTSQYEAFNRISANRLVRFVNVASVRSSVEIVCGYAQEKFIAKHLSGQIAKDTETPHLMRSPSNAARLQEAMDELDKGFGTERTLAE